MEEETLGRSGQSRPTPLTALSEQECWQHLRQHTLGRVAVIVNGRPEIFPVNYRAGGGAVVFRTAPGAKLANAPMTACCFEIDGWDERTGRGWSVMVAGVISEITEAVDHRAAGLLETPVQPVAPGERKHWLALYAEAVSGRRFTTGPVAPAVV
jgi:nitroimidazol reductase NimA-like FMN-containing flavoprotein (pyridoxamine 5'-phosphate oxidase superfamily)